MEASPLRLHPADAYQSQFPKALADTKDRDPEDARLLALARSLTLPIWSNDRIYMITILSAILRPINPPPGKTLLIVLLLAVGLRIAFVAVNDQANDDHLSVIQVIAYEHRIPEDWEFWEAFQPKLYHMSVATVLQAFPVLSPWAQVRLAQACSCVAAVATLFLLLSFLQSFNVSEPARLMTFALVALNPKMISISVQATNDAFVVLFASVAIFFGYRFFQEPRVRSFLGMTVGALLAGVSKGNGLVVSLATTCVFAALVVRPSGEDVRGRLRMAGFAAVFVIAFTAFVPVLGGYWAKYQHWGSPFVINQEVAPPPHLVQKTCVKRPGITSIVDGFFTFRLLDMLREPLITNGADYPIHRTSLWSQLYGRMHSAHFDAWPPSWQSRTMPVQWLGRIALVLALIPTGIMIVGSFRAFLASARWLVERTTLRTRPEDLYLAVSAFGYLSFIIMNVYRYRGFDTMKVIFVFPAVLAFATYTALELERMLHQQRSRVGRGVLGLSIALCCVYVLDVSEIIGRLGKTMGDPVGGFGGGPSFHCSSCLGLCSGRCCL